MFYALYDSDGNLVHVTDKSPWTGTPVMAEITDANGNKVDYVTVKDHHDWKKFEDAEVVAKFATEEMGIHMMASDAGEWVSPRFSIFCPPKVGQEVSQGFNGDYHHVGKIVRITPNWMVVVEDAEGNVTKFNRRKSTAVWKPIGGYGSMVHGVVNRYNPEF